MYYIAIIVVCALPGTDYSGCFELKDNWGPYDSVTTCKNRAEEMEAEAILIFKNRKFPYEPVRWRCDYYDDEVGT